MGLKVTHPPRSQYTSHMTARGCLECIMDQKIGCSEHLRYQGKYVRRTTPGPEGICMYDSVTHQLLLLLLLLHSHGEAQTSLKTC